MVYGGIKKPLDVLVVKAVIYYLAVAAALNDARLLENTQLMRDG